MRRGEQLWLCQQCVGYSCERCGAPLDRVPGYEVVHDDGSIWHHAVLPAPLRCTASSCGKRQAGPPGKGPRRLGDEEG